MQDKPDIDDASLNIKTENIDDDTPKEAPTEDRNQKYHCTNTKERNCKCNGAARRPRDHIVGKGGDAKREPALIKCSWPDFYLCVACK